MLGGRIFASYRLYHFKQKYFLKNKSGRPADIDENMNPGYLPENTLDQLHRKNAEAVYELCIRLRGYFIKLAQFVATRKDLLPPAYVEVLGRLHDNVPPSATAAIESQIEGSLGKPVDQVFSDFSVEPLAAASLAQVHQAVTSSGEVVAVKVQTPGIQEIMERDLAFLIFVGSIFKKFLVRKHLETVFSEVSSSVALELDYKNEIANMELFKETFAGNANIVIPSPIPALSSDKVLTMSLVRGTPIALFLIQAEREGDKAAIKHVFEILIDVFCQQILVHSFFHVDPHPGNFMVTPEGKLGVLDFGCVQKNSPEITKAYIQLVMAIVSKNKDQSAKLLKEMGFETQNGQLETLGELADVMMAIFQKTPANPSVTTDPAQRIEALVGLLRENPLVKMPDHFVMIARVFSSLAGLYFHYQPEIDLFKLIAPHMAAAMAQLRSA